VQRGYNGRGGGRLHGSMRGVTIINIMEAASKRPPEFYERGEIYAKIRKSVRRDHACGAVDVAALRPGVCGGGQRVLRD